MTQPSRDDYFPTASIETLRRRARLLKEVRAFFDAREYLEVETPLLSHDVVVDAWIEPFRVPVDAPGRQTEETLYLQTSPEFGMKRLLAAGVTSVYQVTRAFRRGEQGPLHNCEFTMIEWYKTGDTHREQMGVVEELVDAVFRCARTYDDPRDIRSGATVTTPFPRLTYDGAFKQFAGTRVLTLSMRELRELAQSKGIVGPESLSEDDRDGWLNLLWVELIEPRLASLGAIFIHDYPASQAALARIRPGFPPVAERFELYLHGVEVCNGYHELTDAEELRGRMQIQSNIRSLAGLPALPLDNRLLAAMEHGLPDCSGVALGFDRLALLALGGTSLSEVMAFPFPRA